MLTIVVGGFYGDEGKGKIIGYLSVKDNPDIVVRSGGGPQTGHTVIPGKAVAQVPSAGVVNDSSRLLVARDVVVNPDIILKEIAEYRLESRIGIDYGCTIIEPQHTDWKAVSNRKESLSQGSGPSVPGQDQQGSIEF